MILSVSKRTDIPAFYSNWFFNRIKDGFVLIRNPFNYNQVSKVEITPEVVDCIIFWSKDPKPMIDRLDLIKDYKYYFQVTITPYDKTIEKNVREKKEIINTFIELSNKIGKEKVIWRYDPIFLSDKYTINYHTRLFNRMCELLSPYTDKCVISFIDSYKKIDKSINKNQIKFLSELEMQEIAKEFSIIARKYNLNLETCAEKVDLSEYNISHGACINQQMIQSIIGCKLKDLKKPKERDGCGCYTSIDIGQYDTCLNDCIYCYATRSYDLAKKKYFEHNEYSPMLFGQYEEVVVKDRKVKSLKDRKIELNYNQIKFDDLTNH